VEGPHCAAWRIACAMRRHALTTALSYGGCGSSCGFCGTELRASSGSKLRRVHAPPAGAFVGIGYAPAAWLDFTLRGMHAVFDDDLGVRGDLAARAPRPFTSAQASPSLRGGADSGSRGAPFLTWSP
jgi:hypothetical protein